MKGLFLLQCVIQFLTPLGGPDLEDDFEYEELPLVGEESEKTPLVRNISEFRFW